MKGNPALPEGSLKSKPTWSSTFGCLATSAFFEDFSHGYGSNRQDRVGTPRAVKPSVLREEIHSQPAL
jgi:hypothetical protein